MQEVLAGNEYTEAVRHDIAQAAAYGANGVPFFVFEGQYAVSGAQSTEVFSKVPEQVWQAAKTRRVGAKR